MRIVDNLLALRILWLLVTPYEKTDAYKLGLISADGEFLRKAKTSEEINSSSMLHRLVWRIKRFINLVPGGSTKIGSMVAAYALVRECVGKDNYQPTQEQLSESYEDIDNMETADYTSLAEDVKHVVEDAPANATAGAAVQEPAIKKKAITRFKTSNNTFDKFNKGTHKARRISAMLNLEHVTDQTIYTYTKNNSSGMFIIENDNGRCKVVSYMKMESDVSKDSVRIVESYLSGYYVTVEELY